MTFIFLTQKKIQELLAQQLKVLGTGGSCTVYLVEVNGALCCLKVANDKHLGHMFHREFEILLELNGAAGAPKPLGTSAGFPAMLTTFCGHHTFCNLSLLAHSDTDKLSAFVLLARKVEELHAHGFTHNDIKENNVVLSYDTDGRLQVSLIDYGLAKKFGFTFHNFDTNRRCVWMAPELHKGAPCDPSFDVFSLGQILNRILFKCQTRYPRLEVLAVRAMSTNPSLRPSVATIIKTISEYTGQTTKEPKRFGRRVKTFKNSSFVRSLLKFFCCCYTRRRKY